MAPDTDKETDTMHHIRVPSVRRRRGVLVLLAAATTLLLSGCKGGDLVSYELPARSARYTFETETDGVRTVWRYSSAKATEDDTATLSPCIGELVGSNQATCRPEPLIFLRYDFGLALDNTARAGAAHEVTVVGYYQERLSALPEVTSLKAETTFDGGSTWHPAPSKATGRNTFTTTIKNPRRDQAPKGVGLRISATDSQGNTVTQTIPQAYSLR
ncbi:hypothetical protein DI272_17555 [Streptomyces sp. Act143]|uniref:hypothetical protein n=1 Tax=Streptomyces sp. Act143 TaxID=2200760 RepID=UPI000D68331A|nr:hypothetical protein [Streptomyces sp. Act143]PWI15777.1 hypothetical protein DI272_17555 [Streptomyces sp. Act143]